MVLADSKYRRYCRTKLFDNPLVRLHGELYCLTRVFLFHPANDNTRKAATLIVIGTWGLMEVLGATDIATLPDSFYLIRLFVGILIGRMWGIQFNSVAGMDFTYENGDDQDD